MNWNANNGLTWVDLWMGQKITKLLATVGCEICIKLWNKKIYLKPTLSWLPCSVCSKLLLTFESPHDKTNNVAVHPAKTQISLGIRPVWSESSLSAWRKLGSLATHWAHSEGSDQTVHADLSLRWAHSHFVGFDMRWLICKMQVLERMWTSEYSD